MNTFAVQEGPDFRVLFESVPGLYLVLAPDSQFTIIAASDAYLRATMTTRAGVLGRGLFEVFPDNPKDPSANGAASLHASLRRVLRDRCSDTMALQKYDIQRPAEQGGGFEERYWSPVNSPVLAVDGSCRYIIHRVEDVTEFVRLNQQRQEQWRVTEELRQKADRNELEVFQRAQELGDAARNAFSRLQAQLERLSLLQHITRAIGERQDLRSICQVVVRSIEDRLPVDFACMGQYTPAENCIVVSCVGVKSGALAMDMALGEQSRIAVEDRGLARCIAGQVVYEPDISRVPSSIAARLADAGLRSAVFVPVRLESQTFGVLIAARDSPQAFSAGECEFLAQLAEHVALAANNAQLYQALQSAYEDLRATQQTALQRERLRALGQMSSGIAHDINNSITPAALYLDALLENAASLPGEVTQRLDVIRRAVHDVAATVARMREFYRPREAQHTLAPVQLDDLVRQVVDLTRARWRDMPLENGIAVDLKLELAPSLPAVMGIDHELREALINLLFNAVDAMPAGGTVTIRTRSEADGRVLLEVADTGVGMDEEARRRCLEPFFTTKGERGTGLGLAMVFGIAQRHAADIEIDSEVGVGTTFRLHLGAASAASAPVSESAAAVLAPRRILIVDDDPVLLQSLHDALAIGGHEVVMAHGGEEGVQLFRAALGSGKGFDVVFTDLGMPYVDGRQVAATVKSISPTTPVIMLTGWGQRMNDEAEKPLNVDHLLGKPPRLSDLRGALNAVLGARS